MSNSNNEVVVELPPKPTRKEILEMIDEMIKIYDNLPPGAHLAPVTHSDLHSVLLLMSALFKADS